MMDNERFQEIKGLFEFERLNRADQEELIDEVERLRANQAALLEQCKTALVFCETAAAHLIDDEYRRLVVEPLKAAIAKAKGAKPQKSPEEIQERIDDNYFDEEFD